jgi:hypothetical protein
VTVTSVDFYATLDGDPVLGTRDIHLIPGLASPRLDQMLAVFATSYSGGRRSSEPPADDFWTVSFAPSFKPSTTQTHTNGVRVDPQTGEVTVKPLPAGSRLRTFTVTATVKQGTATPHTARVRVHVHGAVVERWITPSSLTVRQGTKGMRFSVLARFDDGVIGDITNWALGRPKVNPTDTFAVHPDGSTEPVHRWSAGSSSGPGMAVDPATGTITSQTSGGFVTVNLHVGNGPPIATAKAFAAPPWSTPVKLTRIAGSHFSAIGRAGIHSVLFLPEGFVDDPLGTDRIAYEFYVRDLVHQLNTNSQTRPFDVLSRKFAYFSAWVPSPQAGCSVLAEVYADPADQRSSLPTGHVLGKNATPAEDPKPPAANQLRVQQLIDKVGLPLPAVDLAGTTPGGGLAIAWRDLYGVDPAAIVDAFPEWLRRNNRVLLNEVDTAFHIGHNHRPYAMADVGDIMHLTFHPLRMTDADFNTFLRALTDDQGKPLPPVWAEGGADQALVVIVCRTGRWGGANVPRNSSGAQYIAVAIESRETYEFTSGTPGQDLVPDPIPSNVDPAPWSLTAHELAHSFGLADEYGRGGALPAKLVDHVRAHHNVQELASLQANGVLLATNIKWRWLRLRRAAVLRSPSAGVDPVRPDPDGGGQYLITVGREQAIEFDASQDIVRLRTRGPLRTPTFSDRLRLLAVHANTLTVRPLSDVGFDPRIWNPGDLVVVPARGPDPDFSARILGPDLELVHKSVVDLINTTHNPLNARNGATANRQCATPDPVPRDEANLFATKPRGPRMARRIVGLFEGGAAFDCGVFHPTGQCTMSESTFTGPGGGVISTPFCAVCRYAMVELIDPSGHGQIDADYDQEYPR